MEGLTAPSASQKSRRDTADRGNERAVDHLVAVLGRVEGRAEIDLRVSARGRIRTANVGSDVDLVAPDLFDQPGGVPRYDAAGEDLDPSPCTGNDLAKVFHPVFDVRAPARGEDAAESQVDEAFEAFLRLGHHVKGPVEDGLRPSCAPQELPGSTLVQGAALVEHAEDDPVRAVLNGLLDVMLHDFELRPRVAEAAAPRPDHHHDRDVETLPGSDDRAGARGQPAEEQRRVQLHPVRSARLGFQRVVERTAAHLYENAHAYRTTLALPPSARARTCSSLAIVTSPGYVVRRAPCAHPSLSALSGGSPWRNPYTSPAANPSPPPIRSMNVELDFGGLVEDALVPEKSLPDMARRGADLAKRRRDGPEVRVLRESPPDRGAEAAGVHARMPLRNLGSGNSQAELQVLLVADQDVGVRRNCAVHFEGARGAAL